MTDTCFAGRTLVKFWILHYDLKMIYPHPYIFSTWTFRPIQLPHMMCSLCLLLICRSTELISEAFSSHVNEDPLRFGKACDEETVQRIYNTRSNQRNHTNRESNQSKLVIGVWIFITNHLTNQDCVPVKKQLNEAASNCLPLESRWLLASLLIVIS